MRLTLILATVIGLISGAASACGVDSDCVVGARHYRIAMPETANAPVPAIVFAHGYRGSAAGVMRNGSLRRMAADLGAALIAVDADGPGWNLPNGPRTPDSDGSAEFAYFEAVLADAQARFGIDRGRVMATGFSAGGMMVWNLICARSESFAGFAPIAGTFWLKPPETCAAPVASVIHIHGDADRTVPLEGRAIGPTRQGRVAEALEMYGEFGGFEGLNPARYDGLSCEEQSNPAGEVLKFCLFEGGHSFRTEHVRFAWEQLQQAGRL